MAVRILGAPWAGWLTLLNWLPLTMALCSVAALLWIRTKIATALCRVPKVRGSVWKFVKNLKVNQFIDMMELRMSSLFALASSIFMRRVRRLVYQTVMANELFKGKLLPTLIYDLLEADELAPPLTWLYPSEASRQTATATLPTTLWFTDPGQLRHLIACGQLTICRKVLLHILKRANYDPGAIPLHLRPLFEEAKSLYEQLNGNPYAFVDSP